MAEPLDSRLLLAAFGLGAVSCIATVVVNFPINQQIATWNPAALPADYATLLRRWRNWHHVRLITLLPATCLVLIAMLRPQPS
jgi:uncharacterized membrane protein